MTLRQLKFKGVPERDAKTGLVKKDAKLVATKVLVAGEKAARAVKPGDVLELTEGQAGTLLAEWGSAFELGETVQKEDAPEPAK
jgi:hypothetical protein